MFLDYILDDIIDDDIPDHDKDINDTNDDDENYNYDSNENNDGDHLNDNKVNNMIMIWLSDNNDIPDNTFFITHVYVHR